jgi:hypothetical protein
MWLMKKSKKKQEEPTEAISNFSEVFYSMEDELLVEMAVLYPQQLRDLCLFLTLDRQMAEEEIQYKTVVYLD